MSVDAVQDKFAEFSVTPEAIKLVGAEGAVVSSASVVTLIILLETDSFPAASLALMLNAYVVSADNPFDW